MLGIQQLLVEHVMSVELDTAFIISRIRHIRSVTYAVSCEVQSQIRHIFFAGYDTRSHSYLHCKYCYQEHDNLSNGCAFLNGELREVVYVIQPEGFVDQDQPNHVYRLKKALYGLKQAPRAWYDMLSNFLLSQEFSKGAIDLTLFTRKVGGDILLKGTIDMDLCYSKDSCITLTAHADADHVGCQDTRRSTSRKYQLADIFTKALPQERFNFLIERLGMKSMSPETLKCLAEEEE
ncbi:retrovirus-related pol polyprotein from transposon TNT 1-94 [Tanacetum coccineum]